MQTPLRPTLHSIDRNGNTNDNFSVKKLTEKRTCNRRSWITSPDQERRISQREKQVSYGFATDGYRNMIKLVEHDPLLKSGGVLPLPPPDVHKGSKRNWDVSLRKWRRALHMFDSVFIDGKDEGSKTPESVIEEQRLQWVNPIFADEPKERRMVLSIEKIMDVKNSPFVPSKLPVEENLKSILRSEDCYEPVSNVVPPCASSLIKGTDISPLDAGIKIHVAPSSITQTIATPGKYSVCSPQQTPQHINPGVVISGNSEISPIRPYTFTSPSTCKTRPEVVSISRVQPPINNTMGCDGYCTSPFLLTHQTVHANIGVQAPKQPWNCFIAPTALFSVPQQAPSFSPVVMDKKDTPVTAPRRITRLQSTGQSRKFGEVETIQRNLFPNTVFSPIDLKKGNSQSIGVLQKDDKNNKEILHLENGKNDHQTDVVSQQLFPEN